MGAVTPLRLLTATLIVLSVVAGGFTLLGGELREAGR
jgi:hypothetical protein